MDSRQFIQQCNFIFDAVNDFCCKLSKKSKQSNWHAPLNNPPPLETTTDNNNNNNPTTTLLQNNDNTPAQNNPTSTPLEKIILKLYLYQVEGDVFICNDRDLIFQSVAVLNHLCYNGVDYQEGCFYFGISHNTLKKLFLQGIALSKYFYINYFQTSKFWTYQKLQDTVFPEFRILFGYVHFCTLLSYHFQ